MYVHIIYIQIYTLVYQICYLFPVNSPIAQIIIEYKLKVLNYL